MPERVHHYEDNPQVSMKSGLGDRNNINSKAIDPIPAMAVSMKSGLGDRNNPNTQIGDTPS